LMGASSIMAQTTQAKNSNMANISKAWEFAQYGYNNKSVLALITAAQVLYTVPVTSAIQQDATVTAFSSKQLLEDAKTMAKGDQNLLAMITKVEGEKPEKSRGSQAELMAYNFTLFASASKTFNFSYNGGAEAVVSVKSNGETPPTITVKSSNGKVVETTPGTEPNSVKWTPTKKDQFQITIKNIDGGDIKCVFITN